MRYAVSFLLLALSASFNGVMTYAGTPENTPETQEQSLNDTIILETMPTFPGGEVGLINCISRELRYPAEAMKKNITGCVKVEFLVNKTGKVSDARVKESCHPLLDAEAVRVVKLLKGFRPATKDGKPVNVWFTLPINFRLRDEHPSNQQVVSDSEEILDGEKVYVAAEEMPRFHGGEAKLSKYISQNIKNPGTVDSQGIVVVQFVVTKTGKIGEVKVIRSRNKELDAEAVRVIKTLPDFIPGKINGEPVNVWYTLPVSFNGL